MAAWQQVSRGFDVRDVGTSGATISAAGGVGLHVLAILAAMGAVPIAVVGRESKRRWLIEDRGLAPHQVVVRDRRSFGADLDRALAAVGAKGFDLVFDAVAGLYFQPAYDSPAA